MENFLMHMIVGRTGVWLGCLLVTLFCMLIHFIRWAIEEISDQWPRWRRERQNRKAIHQLWRTYGRKPPRGL